MPSRVSTRVCVPLRIIIALCNLKRETSIRKRYVLYKPLTETPPRAKRRAHVLDPVTLLCSIKSYKYKSYITTSPETEPSELTFDNKTLPPVGSKVVSINRLKTNSRNHLEAHCFYGTVAPVPSGPQYAKVAVCVHYHCTDTTDVYSVEYMTLTEFTTRRVRQIPQHFIGQIETDGVYISSNTVILCDIALQSP